MEIEGQNLSYDKMLCIGKEYDEEKALQLCREMKRIALEACKSEDEKAELKDMTLEKLEDFGVLSKSGKKFSVTNAFELMTDNKNRNAKVQCALFKGTTRDIFIDQKEFTGPIYEQVDDAYHFILRHINMGAEINGVYRSEEYELPIKAIREMVANAVVHRSYLDEACVQVCIFDDRIEVGDGIKVTMFRKVHSDTEQVVMGEVQTNKESENEELKYSVVSIRLDEKEYTRLMEFLNVPRTRQEFCGYKSRNYLRKNILVPLIEAGKVDMTIPEKPQSSKQKYVKHTKR